MTDLGIRSVLMGRYDRKDRYYKKAKDEGRASRAYYKLEQIQQKHKIIKKGDFVVDLGCAPGGWLEYTSKLVGQGGCVFGIDILPIKINPVPNIHFLQGDINDEETLKLITREERRVDVVISDMAPSTSGIRFRDSFLSYELSASAFEIAKKILKPNGNFITKIFPGEEFAGFKKELEKSFKKVDQYRPPATRETSIEVYLVAIGYKG